MVVYATEPPNDVLAINLGTSVVVVSPQVNDAYSREVIAAIHARWPGRRIGYVVSPEFHFDEAGGIRQYAGHTILVPGHVSFFRSVLGPSATRTPVVAVGSRGMSLGAGMVGIHVFHSSYEDKMLLVCAGNLAYTDDLFLPGIFASNAPAPPPFNEWAREYYHAIEQYCPAVTKVMSSNGKPNPEPISQLITSGG